MKKRLISFFLTIVIITGLIPYGIQTAFADTRNGMSDSTGCSSTMRWSSGDNKAAVDSNYTIIVDYLSARPGCLFVQGWVVSKNHLQVSMPVYVPNGTMWCNMYYRGDVSQGGRNNGFNIYIPMSSGQHNDITFMAYSGDGNFQIFYVNAYVTKPTATFDQQGGIGGTASVTVDYNTANPTIMVPTRTGYDFHGYYTGMNGTGTKYWNADGTGASQWKLTGSQTVYAYWTPHVYTVTLDNGTDYIKTDGTATTSATYTCSMEAIVLPEKYGYTFNGYYTQTAGGDMYYDADGTSAHDWDIAENTTLYAQWTRNDYSISYYDGSSEITESTDARINDAGCMTVFNCEEAVTLPVDVTKENAIFLGWYEDSTLSGSAVYQWPAHDETRTTDQSFYACWVEIAGTRADSEKQGFDASLFNSAVPSYSTADVTVRLDGTNTNVSQVQLKQDGKDAITMGGTDGEYSYTTAEDVSGEWNIWVNGIDSGIRLEFGTPAAVDMINAAVTVTSDDTPDSGRNVVIKNADKSLTLSESASEGVYTLQTFAEDKDYAVYIGGENTGVTLNLKDKTESKVEIDYYTAEVSVKKDGVPAHMGAVELKTDASVLVLVGTDGNYSLNRLKDTDTSYDLYIDGSDTGFDIKFSSDDKSRTVNYHTVTVKTKADDVPADISGITLRDNSNNIIYTLNADSAGVYTAVSRESDAEYKVYAGNDYTGITASFTESGKSPADVKYYTVQVDTTKDGSFSNMGTVILKNGDTELTVPGSSTGKYSLMKAEDGSTVYSVFVGGEDVGKTVKFTAQERNCTVSYASVTLTANTDGLADNAGAVTLKTSGRPDISMLYDSGEKQYKAVTCFGDNRDVYVNDSDTGVDLFVGQACSLNYYTLSYALNGGSGDMPAGKAYISGSMVKLPDAIPAKENYQFAGWSADNGAGVTFALDTDGNFSGTDNNRITVSSTCSALMAMWSENTLYEAKYKNLGDTQWTYSTLQYAADYAVSHSSDKFEIELCRDAALINGSEVSSNASVTVPESMTLSGDFTNNGSIVLNGTLSGTVTNNGLIDGGGTINSDDTLADAGTAAALVNQSDAVVKQCNIGCVASNAGTLTDIRIVSGTDISGTVNGTVYAEAGVSFASSLKTYSSDGTEAVISLTGGGTINSSADMNATDAFAGLMISNGSHSTVSADVHLRNKLTINDNQIYADFFDFTVPSDLSYNGSTHAALFSGSRTAGIGQITAVHYRYMPTESTGWLGWMNEEPIGYGTYQVSIDVADGEYYYGRNGISDSDVWTFIIKRPVVAMWMEKSKSYTGEQLDPDYQLGGAEKIHTGDVSIVLDDNERINAGSYNVNACLTGSAVKYYELTNPCTDFTIQEAPVTFTVTDDSCLYDGTSKSAVISASADGEAFSSFAAVYKDSKGNSFEMPSEAGDYGIYALITDDNYRFDGYTDGSEQRIGTLTIYETEAPKTYSVSFDGGEGSAGTMPDLTPVKAGENRMLPLCSFTSAGSIFAGWELDGKVYRAGELYSQPAKNITASAVWTENVYTAEGILTDFGGNPQENAVITLMSGARKAGQAVTSSSGAFSFSNVLPGTYNLVFNYNGIIVTGTVAIADDDVDDIQLTLPAGRTNSVVEVDAGTAEIVVSGLDDSFSSIGGIYTSDDAAVVSGGGIVEFKLAVTENESPDADKQDELKRYSSNICMYIDFDLSKTVTAASGVSTESSLYSSDTMLAVRIPLPAALQGKDGYEVFRYHSYDGSAANEELSRLRQLGGSGMPDEEGYRVSSDKKTLTIYTRSFSLYAVGYVNNTYDDEAPWIVAYLNCRKDTECVINRYTDADPKVWYHDGLHFCIENNYMNGVAEKLFAPDETLSRAMIVRILWNIEGKPVTSSVMTFNDVPEDQWYTEAVRWAQKKKIVDGYTAEAFGPDDYVTREQLAAILYRYAKYKGYNVSKKADLSAFVDTDMISDWALENVKWANAAGIINGRTSSTIVPTGNATRAEAACMIQRFCRRVAR